MSKLFAAAAFAALLSASPAWANAASTKLAYSLSGILASETFCGLAYDPAGIAAFIDKNVAADDMEFPGNLRWMTEQSGVKLKELSPSHKTAHCEQVKRVAKTYSFIN